MPANKAICRAKELDPGCKIELTIDRIETHRDNSGLDIGSVRIVFPGGTFIEMHGNEWVTVTARDRAPSQAWMD